jgi:hypothetical protein
VNVSILKANPRPPNIILKSSCGSISLRKPPKPPPPKKSARVRYKRMSGECVYIYIYDGTIILIDAGVVSAPLVRIREHSIRLADLLELLLGILQAIPSA